MEKRKVFQCTECRNQVSLTANIIFHKTRTPLKKWFWAIYLAGSDKRGCSAKRLQKMIDVSYATAWLIIHKIRHAMKERDSLYKLSNIIEMDDSYFGGSAPGKRGRGAANKSKVVVAVENRGTALRYPRSVANRLFPLGAEGFGEIHEIVKSDRGKRLNIINIIKGL